MSAGEIKNDGFGGLSFQDPELEREFQSFSVEQGNEAGVYVPWIGAFLFFVTAPLDYFVFGDRSFNDLVWLSFGVRLITIIILIIVALWLRYGSLQTKNRAVVISWTVVTAALWWLTIVAPPTTAPFYLLNMGIHSLTIISLVPALSISQTRAMNGFLVFPFVFTGIDNYAYWTSLDVANFAQSGFILCATIFFGSYSKYTYERALRGEFFRGKQLAIARDQALAADLAKTNFLSAVSHDMRTPLNAILGNIQLLRQSAGDDGHLLDDAETASRTLFHLVEGVLQSARGAATKPTLETVSVKALLDEVRANIQSLTDAKALKLELTERGSREHIRTDPRLIMQVWLNLMNNATKFTDKGTVGLRVRNHGDKLRFLVHDTGRGIAPKDVKRAFERHFIGQETDTAQGFGLGLAISRDIVALLGGALRIRSRPGQGTVVSGWVPVAQALAIDEEVAKAEPEKPLPRHKILIIEDEPLNVTVLTRMLELLGQDYKVATNASDGLALYAAEAFDLVLTDIRLPDMSGLQLLREIMKLPNSLEDDAAPIYAVTANALPEDIARYEQAGFDGVIPKPISLELLSQTLAGQGGLDTPSDKNPAERVGLTSELRALYEQTFGDCLAQIKVGCSSGDPKLIAQMAHKLRGAALYAQDTATAELAQDIETTASAHHEGATGTFETILEQADRLSLPV